MKGEERENFNEERNKEQRQLLNAIRSVPKRRKTALA